MTTTNGPFKLIEQHADLVIGDVLAEHQGQARQVCLVESHRGWIYKEYKYPLSSADEKQIEQLINLPARLTPAERAVLRHGASWPTSRVVKEGITWGVLIPLADEKFEADFQLPGGRVQRRTLAVDWLAQPDDALRARGIPPPSLAQRVKVCASLAGTAALFERHGVVYLDWSFTNAFWSHHDHSSYVIDVDGCSFGPRRMIECPGWEDPQFAMGSEGGVEVDRYRVALLVARCLTVERTATDALAAADRLTRYAADEPALEQVDDLIGKALRTDRPADRTRIADLAAALENVCKALGAATGVRTGRTPVKDGVTGWRTVQRPGLTTAPAGPTRSRPSTPTTRAGSGPSRGTTNSGRSTEPAPLGPRPFTPPPDSVVHDQGPGQDGAAAVVITLAVLALIALIVLVIIL